MRESVNAWIWDDQLAIGLPRCGVEAVADQWDTHDIQINVACADGRVFSAVEPGAVHDPLGADGQVRILGAGSLSFELVEPFVHWRMHIDGTVRRQHGGRADRRRSSPGRASGCRCTATIDLRSAAPPWMNGALLPEAKRILDTQEEGDLMGHPWRFEQLCRTSGTVAHRRRGAPHRGRRQPHPPPGHPQGGSAVGPRLAGGDLPERARLRLHHLPAPQGREGRRSTRATSSSATASSSRLG